MFANFCRGVHEFCYRISLIYKCCREISIVVALVVLCCLRKSLLLCLLNDVVVTFVGHRTSLSSPKPHLHSPRTSTHPHSSHRHFRSSHSISAKQEIPEVNICTITAFIVFFVHKRKNEKTEVKLPVFVFCPKRKKPKNGSRIAFFVFCTRSKKEKTEVELFFPFCTH